MFERDLIFLGFIIINNKLKIGTIPLLTALRDANKISKMSTGDNIDTAIACALES